VVAPCEVEDEKERLVFAFQIQPSGSKKLAIMNRVPE